MSIVKQQKNQYKGKIILILGPSGSGKGTIIQFLKGKNLDLQFPASFTTRPMRPGEKEGDVYHFVTKDQFKQKINNGDFLEWAIVHADNYYGTDKKEILTKLEKGQTVMREVDIQGVESIQKLLDPQNIITIFITTDSWEKLENRIKKRAEISDAELANRKKSYYEEKEFLPKCTHVIYSEDGKIDEANQEALEIVKKYIA